MSSDNLTPEQAHLRQLEPDAKSLLHLIQGTLAYGLDEQKMASVEQFMFDGVEAKLNQLALSSQLYKHLKLVLEQLRQEDTQLPSAAQQHPLGQHSPTRAALEQLAADWEARSNALQNDFALGLSAAAGQLRAALATAEVQP